MTQADHLVYAESTAPLVVSIRRGQHDDRRFIGQSWKESYKDAPGHRRTPWRMYNQTTAKDIYELLEKPFVELLVAQESGGRIAGWIAFTRGKSISTLHWVFTRSLLHDQTCKLAWSRQAKDPPPCTCTPAVLRRRGVMTALLEAADLGKRFAYTFRGPRPHVGGKRGGGGVPMDDVLVAWLRGRGVTAVYVPLVEWLT